MADTAIVTAAHAEVMVLSPPPAVRVTAAFLEVMSYDGPVVISDTLTDTANLSETTATEQTLGVVTVHSLSVIETTYLGKSLSDTLTDIMAVFVALEVYRAAGGLASDGVLTTDASVGAQTLRPTLAEILNITEPLLFYDQLYSATATDSMTLEATLASVAWGALLEETPTIAAAITAAWKLVEGLTEQATLTDTERHAVGLTFTQALSLTSTLTPIRGALLLESLGLSAVVAAAWKGATSLAEQVALQEALSRGLGGQVGESLAITATALQAVGARVQDTATLSDTPSRVLTVRVVAEDTVDITPTEALKQLFRPTLTDVVELVGLYLEPGAAPVTWAVNTATGATTEYRNYAFNSFAMHGTRYLGANDTGLYTLDGAQDGVGTGTPANVVSRIASGFLQFGDTRYSAFQAIYLGLHGSGDVYLRLETGEGKQYTYKVVTQSRENTKVRVGKGLRARYFAFELETTGADFDLDSIEFLPLVAQRRV
jgi:hypothetical protein